MILKEVIDGRYNMVMDLVTISPMNCDSLVDCIEYGISVRVNALEECNAIGIGKFIFGPNVDEVRYIMNARITDTTTGEEIDLIPYAATTYPEPIILVDHRNMNLLYMYETMERLGLVAPLSVCVCFRAGGVEISQRLFTKIVYKQYDTEDDILIDAHAAGVIPSKVFAPEEHPAYYAWYKRNVKWCSLDDYPVWTDQLEEFNAVVKANIRSERSTLLDIANNI